MQRYSSGSIAKLLTVTETDLRKLVADGSIPAAAEGGWDLVEVVQAYISHLRSRRAHAGISGPDLAVHLGISEQGLRDLTARGIVHKVSRGVWDRDASTIAYIAHLRGVAAGRSDVGTGAPGGEGETTTLTAERTRLAKEQADGKAIENALARGDLLPADAVEREWAGILHTLRARLLAIPSRLRARLGHLPTSDAVVIDREIRDVLDDLGHDRVGPPDDRPPDHADAPGGSL